MIYSRWAALFKAWKWSLPGQLLAVVIAAYVAVFLYLIHQRYIYLELYDVMDTATNMQTVWSVVHGPFFTATVNDYLKPVPHNVLGDQLYFTLLLYLPFWLVFKSPFTFVAVTVIAAGLASVPLYHLTNDKLGSPWLSLAVAANFLFNSFCYDTYFLFGFRPEVLFMPFILAAFLFARRGQYMAALAFFILTLLTKHNAVVILAASGAYLMFQGQKPRRLGALLIALALLYFFGVVRPLFAHYGYSPTAMIKLLGGLGPDPLSALGNALRHPGLYFREVSRPELGFLAGGLAPTAFLGLFSPVTYIGLFDTLYNFLYNEYGSIHCGWHWAAVAPFVYIGAADTMGRLKKRVETLPRRRLLILAASLFAAVFLFEADSLLTHARYRERFYYRNNHVDTRKMIEALDVIEPEASVTTMYRLLWFTCMRREAYYARDRFHYGSDYVVVTRPLELGDNEITDHFLVRELKDKDSLLRRDYYPLLVQDNIMIMKKKGR